MHSTRSSSGLRSVLWIFSAIALLHLGCDSTTTGQIEEDGRPPGLVRVLVGPLNRGCTRCILTDLLERPKQIACSDTAPCPVEFQLGGNNPVACVIPAGATSGLCSDPLTSPVAVGKVGGDGNAVRLVFSKELNPALETHSTDAMGNPTTGLQANVVELDSNGPAGPAPVMIAPYYDPTGGPTTSDAIVDPFGPAIEVDLVEQLAPNTRYTIKLTSSAVTDRKNQPLSDANGQPLSTPYTHDFTTEPLTALSVTPDVTGALDAAKMTPTITPDEVVQIVFNSTISDPRAPMSPASIKLAMGATNIPVEAWLDDGGDPKKCKKSLNKSQLDIVAVSAPGMPVDLMPGQYTLTIGGVADSIFGLGTFTATYTFFVAGPKVMGDKNSYAKFALPETCTG